MMAKRSRILILVASLALGLLYVLPMWTIELEAPQYPEGIGMVIRLNTIEGQKEHDLKNINGLNHYIGMKPIEPDSIPELRIMPVVVAVLLLTGIGVAVLGRRRLLYAWTLGFLAVSLVGLADFWKWEYDYGHDLDPTAAIQVPGMSYQPPLIGSRQILNFTAHSWPGAGGWIAILAAATAVLVSAGEWRRGRTLAHAAPEGAPDSREPTGGVDGERDAKPRRATAAGHTGATGTVTALALLAALTGCGEPGPRPLAAGVDACADCLMVLDAGGHGAEVVTRTGKILTFDSAECMVNHLLTGDGEEPRSTWVTDFSDPETLVAAEDAYYLVSPTLPSPMGLGITAFARPQDRDGALNAFGGEAADWDDVRSLVASAWPDGRPPMRHGGHAATMTPDSGSGSHGLHRAPEGGPGAD